MPPTPLQNRKYLCAAPRPETWGSIKDAVLSKLGDNKAAETRLTECIAGIRNLHEFKQRQGPGRKSNAEHALHFYEYLLESVQKKKDKNNKTADLSSTSPTDATAKPKVPEEDSDESESDNEVDDNKSSSSRSDSSLDTEQFETQHNDICEVCDQAGQLLMCSTCNLVFHLECVRPKLSAIPAAPFRCSYCILASNEHKRNSRPRKQAAAAVRLMARLRKQHQRQQQQQEEEETQENEKEEAAAADAAGKKEDDNKDDDDEGEKPSSKETKHAPTEISVAKKEEEEEDTKEEGSSGQKDAGSDDDDKSAKEQQDTAAAADTKKTPSKKRPAAAAAPDDTPDSSRSKRSRKQPTLYDPQICAASQWQTDELQEWKMLHNEEDNDDDDDSSEKKPSAATSDQQEDNKDDNNNKTKDVVVAAAAAPVSDRKAARERSNSIWCNFCRDDPDIQVCVFCACRICFGKHHQTKLLLCDRCDEEYHTFCLDPPLTTVPSSKTWYCPSCQNARKSPSRGGGRGRSSSRTTTSTRSPSKRVLRTPSPKQRSSARKTALQQKKKSNEKKKKGSSEKKKTSTGRPRGRPPKKASPPSSSAAAAAPPVKRKRGRPPKAETLARRAREAAEAEAKRSKSVKTWKTRGPSAAAAVQKSPPEPVVVVVKPASPVTVSRSGRTVKKIKPYEDQAEGPQHLKTQVQRSGSNISSGSRTGAVVLQHTAVKPAPLGAGSAAAALPAGLLSSAIAAAATTQPQGIQMATQAAAAALPLQQSQASVAGVATLPVGATTTIMSALAQATRPPTLMSATGPMAASATVVPNAAAYASSTKQEVAKQPRRKPGARECMQISRRFGVKEIPQEYLDILMDYCTRGKVEHLIRMRERLDEHSRFLESQLAGLEALVKEKGESDVVVPLAPPSPGRRQDA